MLRILSEQLRTLEEQEQREESGREGIAEELGRDGIGSEALGLSAEASAVVAATTESSLISSLLP